MLGHSPRPEDRETTKELVGGSVSLKGVTIILAPEEIEKARDWSHRKALAKIPEGHHQTDNRSEVKRSLTGITGEMAVEKLLERTFIDWGIGKSSRYAKPDLEPIGLNWGVKTVSTDLNHAIQIENHYPQVMVFKRSNAELEVMGLATTEVLNSYQDASLIKDKRMRARKTAFTGYEHLMPGGLLKDYVDCLLYEWEWQPRYANKPLKTIG